MIYSIVFRSFNKKTYLKIEILLQNNQVFIIVQKFAPAIILTNIRNQEMDFQVSTWPMDVF